MKVILSRKGFDWAYGGTASPVLPDGTMVSMPIPSGKSDRVKFSDLNINGMTYDKIWDDLLPRLKNKSKYCHLDPDIRKNIRKVPKNWEAGFGQSGASQTHLANNDIKVGDLFLFFGWFKQTEIVNGKLKYIKGAKDAHMLFGYLQIGKILKGKDIRKFKWHPHSNRDVNGKSTIYVASKNLVIDGKRTTLAGYGTFKYSKEVVLTKKGQARSRWDLPKFFQNVSISHHSKKSFKNGYFQSVPIGQEFVVSESKQVSNWAKNIIIHNCES